MSGRAGATVSQPNSKKDVQEGHVNFAMFQMTTGMASREGK